MRRSSRVCPRCLWIRPGDTKDCACTGRMAALERAHRELDPETKAFDVNPTLAADPALAVIPDGPDPGKVQG